MLIQLTERQARRTLRALKDAQNFDFPKSDPINATYQRIIDKIEKEMNKYNSSTQ